MTLSYINCIFESIEIIFTLCKNENDCFSIFIYGGFDGIKRAEITIILQSVEVIYPRDIIDA